MTPFCCLAPERVEQQEWPPGALCIARAAASTCVCRSGDWLLLLFSVRMRYCLAAAVLVVTGHEMCLPIDKMLFCRFKTKDGKVYTGIQFEFVSFGNCNDHVGVRSVPGLCCWVRASSPPKRKAS